MKCKIERGYNFQTKFTIIIDDDDDGDQADEDSDDMPTLIEEICKLDWQLIMLLSNAIAAILYFLYFHSLSYFHLSSAFVFPTWQLLLLTNLYFWKKLFNIIQIVYF